MTGVAKMETKQVSGYKLIFTEELEELIALVFKCMRRGKNKSRAMTLLEMVDNRMTHETESDF